MEKRVSTQDMRPLTSFTDVLYVTDKGQIPYEVKRLLKQHRLSFQTVPIDAYMHMRDHPELIGTVVIDAEGLNAAQENKLAGIIESLEMEGVGVTILTNRVEMPVKSFSLSPSKSSFSMADKTETVSIDDLWVRISVNLAYRKKSSGIAVKPAVPPRHARRFYKNKLAQQLQMTETLVESLAEQLRLAGLVQQDFLPTQLPNDDKSKWATAFCPAEWVSGDIYDVVRVDEGHVGFYLADVVGHGMPAALLTIFLKQALVMRETVDKEYKIFSPAEVMQKLNVKMASQRLSGYQFATCCYGLLNTKTLELTYSRAGHPYPILFREGQEPMQLEARGSLLGIFEQAVYSESKIQLQRGDKLLVYSDGAEKFVGGYDDQGAFHFSEEFMSLQQLSIGDVIERLKVFANSVEADSPEADDVTGLGLEVL